MKPGKKPIFPRLFEPPEDVFDTMKSPFDRLPKWPAFASFVALIVLWLMIFVLLLAFKDR